MTGLARLTVTAAVAVLLTALSLQPTMQNGSWLIPTILCVAAVAGVGYLARRLHSPRLLVPVLQLAALGLVLLPRFAQDVAIWGVLPGRDVLLRAQGLLDEAVTTITSYSSPAPVTPGLVFLIAMSVALVAIVVDTVAVTYRSPALAGLPLLVLYAVPVAVVSNGVSWVYFGIASAGWLALLLADGRERLGGWGRRLGTRAYDGDPTAGGMSGMAEPLGAVGRRIAVASVGLAIAIPAIVPGLSEAVFGRGSADGAGQGDGRTVNTVNPYVSLGADLTRPQDTTVLSYTTTTDNPDYLRLVTLDSFDGRNWLPSSLESSGRITDGPLPSPAGVSESTPRSEITTQVRTVELVESTWLPAPYPISAVSVDGDTAEDWVWDSANRVVWSPEGSARDLRYTVQSLFVEPTQGQLARPTSVDPTFLSTYTELPLSIPDEVRATAREVTDSATTPYLKAAALQDWFRSDLFTYDTSVDLTPDDPLSEFLTTKTGFCQQFAGTFAVMARSLNLPTRVVVGFVRGEKQDDQTWEVTWHDTHAWPEVYFEDSGWVRFEPTKSDNAGVIVPTWTVPQDTGQSGDDRNNRGSVDGPDPSASASAGLPRGALPDEQGDLNRLALGASQAPAFPWVWVLVPLVVLTLLLLPWAARLWQRRRRQATAGGPDPQLAASAAWSELAATCADLDLRWPASRTPRQTAADLIETCALAAPGADALRRMALSTERARYARTPVAVRGLGDDLVTARAGLLEAATTRQRLRATFAPVSLLSKVGATAADTLDWVDAAPRRAGRVLRPRKKRSTQTERAKEFV